MKRILRWASWGMLPLFGLFLLSFVTLVIGCLTGTDSLAEGSIVAALITAPLYMMSWFCWFVLEMTS